MCSCGNEDGCIGLDQGCRCICHYSEIREQRDRYKKALRDVPGTLDTVIHAADVPQAVHTWLPGLMKECREALRD